MSDPRLSLDDVFNLVDETDVEIFMHRDVHFAGSFSLMLDYYQKEGKGACPEYPIERIEQLDTLEKVFGESLAPYLLNGAQVEEVQRGLQRYRLYREIYDKSSSPNSLTCRIADLVLSEEDPAEQEIAAVVELGQEAVPSLVDILTTPEMQSSLSPGYGFAPRDAATALGRIGGEQALRALFSSYGKGDFALDEAIGEAITLMASHAKPLLFDAIHARPLTSDNERAAALLTHFASEEEVANFALEQLQRKDALQQIQLASYLLLCCEGLRDPARVAHLQKLGEDATFPEDLTNDLHSILAGVKDATP